MGAWMGGGAINTISSLQLVNHHHLFVPILHHRRPTSSRRLRLNSSTSGDDAETALVSPQDQTQSLISALNVEKALRGIAITEEDHYGRLGVERGCSSSDEIRLAYKKKLNELLMINTDDDDDQLEHQRQLDLLKESYRILSTNEERRLYDWSLGRNDNPDRYMWPFEVDNTPLVSAENPPPAQPPEDVAPTRLLGYFIFVWFILSIVLLILFNR